MRTVEIESVTDSTGSLHLDYALGSPDSRVKIFVLLDDKNDMDDEKNWLSSISNNPAFDFLSDQEEDIYTSDDGEPCFD